MTARERVLGDGGTARTAAGTVADTEIRRALRLQRSAGSQSFFSVQITLDRKQILRFPQRDAQLRRTLENIGVIAVEEAKRLAPVETGKLRSNIRYTISQRALRSASRTGTGEMVLTVGSEGTPYAIYQEVGTVYTPPHPFLRPALVIALGRFKLQARASLTSRGLHRSATLLYRDRSLLGKPVYSSYRARTDAGS